MNYKSNYKYLCHIDIMSFKLFNNDRLNTIQMLYIVSKGSLFYVGSFGPIKNTINKKML